METTFYAESEQKDRCGIDFPVASHSRHTAWDFCIRKIITLLMFTVCVCVCVCCSFSRSSIEG